MAIEVDILETTTRRQMAETLTKFLNEGWKLEGSVQVTVQEGDRSCGPSKLFHATITRSLMGEPG